MVKDINPGVANSSPSNFISFDNMLYFSANNGSSGVELWKSDGTSAGTVMVKDINTTGDGYPSYFTVHNGVLYFIANPATSGDELWKSDGTSAGTVQVVDLNAGDSSGVGRIFK